MERLNISQKDVAHVADDDQYVDKGDVDIEALVPHIQVAKRKKERQGKKNCVIHANHGKNVLSWECAATFYYR